MKATPFSVYQDATTKKRVQLLEIDPRSDFVATVNMDADSAKPRPTSLRTLQDRIDTHQLLPYAMVSKEPPLTALTRKQAEWLARAMVAFAPLLELSARELCTRKLWRDFREIAPKMGMTPAGVNIVFTKYLQGGMRLIAAVPKWKSGPRSPGADKGLPAKSRPTCQPGAYRLAASDHIKIQAGMRAFWKGKTSVRTAYQKFLEKNYPGGVVQTYAGDVIIPLPKAQRPSFGQFYRHGKRLLGISKRKECALGPKKFKRDCAPSPIGQAAAAERAGYEAEADWTKTGLNVVSSITRLSLGTLVVYVICDRFSGLILSIYVTLENASYEEAARAVLLCLEDKVELCKRYGIEITRDQWPAAHLPEKITADHGEIDSWKSSPLVTGLGLKLKFTRGGMGRDKGSVESGNRMIKDFLRSLEGGTTGRKERMEENPHATAIYDIDQVYAMLLSKAVLWNNRIRKTQPMTADMLGEGVDHAPTPAKVWLDAERKGLLRSVNADQARLHVLPFREASVSERGIAIDGLRYEVPNFPSDDSAAIDANAWLTAAKIRRFKVNVGIDPATVAHVWLHHKLSDGTVIQLKCPLARESEGYAGMSRAEYLKGKEANKPSRDAHESSFDFLEAVDRKLVEKIRGEAMAAAKIAREGTSKADLTRDVDGVRAAEIAHRRAASRPVVAATPQGFTPHVPQPPIPTNHVQ